ncbi:type II secretion system protein GspD [Burkholderia cenocepacia]|uniref:type II secretion system protein GspD n=1 Tax=Burkholderia cenocepacia TaxID=95486 RepID=UPI002AB148B7|nr:type II secretory pathway protein [Burkholderia cenocepacia]
MKRLLITAGLCVWMPMTFAATPDALPVLLSKVAGSHGGSLVQPSAAAASLDTPPLPFRDAQDLSQSPSPTSFDFSGVSVADVSRLLYLQAFKQSYVLDPAVLQDQRQVAFRFKGALVDLRPFWRDFLDGLGYELEPRAGVDFVRPKPKESAQTAADSEVYIYHPKYREVGYLSEILGPLLSGAFTVNRTVHVPASQRGESTGKPVPMGSAAAMIDRPGHDALVYLGSAKDIERLKVLLPQLDTPVGEVLVRGVVYEVTTGNKEGSAFNLVLSLLGNKLSLGVGGAVATAVAPGESFLRFKSASIDAVYSALSSDSRFKVVTNPRLRIQSGKSAHLTVGQEVPTLGAVSYPQGGGTPVQSVTYRSAGVIFDLSPTVYESQIDLQVRQQISDFAKTETGVNDSPTLTKRELDTTVSLGDGEMILLGGLQQDKQTNKRVGLSFLPHVLDSTSGDDSNTEILVLLQVNKVR